MKKDKKTNNKVRIKKIKKIFKWNGKKKRIIDVEYIIKYNIKIYKVTFLSC